MNRLSERKGKMSITQLDLEIADEVIEAGSPQPVPLAEKRDLAIDAAKLIIKQGCSLNDAMQIVWSDEYVRDVLGDWYVAWICDNA
jgi:hypothetical protein